MDRVEELNHRLRDRNIGDTPAFYFSPRPVPTKYTTMPILDEKLPATIPLKNELVFDVTKQFLPGSSAPWSGRIDQIDVESNLLQPVNYIPSSQSDLYKYKIHSKGPVGHPLLFTSVVTPAISQPSYSSNKIFYNDTGIKNLKI
jgi:hypothetical protein